MSNDVHENRIRRMAQRQGFSLTKSRRRDARALEYGMYLLSTIDTNAAMLGGWSTLTQIERFLTPEEAQPRRR
jgi:hypothetical protein